MARTRFSIDSGTGRRSEKPVEVNALVPRTYTSTPDVDVVTMPLKTPRMVSVRT
jgi:hypothetical protein